MHNIPKRLNLANLPTKIEKLHRLSEKLGGPNIYVKRDDQTGTEVAGNKIRKLEYTLHEAISQGADTLITCGGIQSNHCRTTAAAAAKLGLKTKLVLRGQQPAAPDGNLLLDVLFGADIHWVTPEEYRNRRNDIMTGLKEELAQQERHAYIIPEGASNGIGAFGYYSAMEEIIQQEKEMGVQFDAVVMAVGSGGTYAGLLLAQKIFKTSHEIIGFNVSNDAEYFHRAIMKVLEDAEKHLESSVEICSKDIRIIDGYVGLGYAIGRPEERAFIKELAMLEGIVLDPVYTGKGFYGLTEEIKKGRLEHLNNILFIHTGGLYGIFPQGKEFANLLP
ncbi:D-cysteine desulfhydrase family protein [Planococcus shenhongbingii]|uniref:D-cysteine desulfhydrase family protein n=1 Tax=Planococcus shenhongbingii TaxID=3058398 RepID=A0ABT8N8T8_9BACL|nr:D-cysteine desulfhydrase family protein [Planococcus sp. N017]MDN7244114.1 D-cysteine desulfhydrase family protein [Planococcus sp. N017]